MIRWKQLLGIFFLAMILMMGCGGGGGSTSRDGDTSETNDNPPRDRLLQATEAAINALDEEAEKGSAMEKLFIGNQLAGNLIPLARGEVAPGKPSCVSVESEGETLFLSFDGSDDCNAVSGTLQITPVSSQYGDPSIFVTDIDLIEFDTGDGCPVNGRERSTVTIEGSQIQAVCTYTDLDLCGRSISGQLVLRGEAPGDWQIALGAQTYLFQADVEVHTEIDWEPETGAMVGKTEVLMGGDRYVMRAEEVVMDACGVPTGGRLTIIDPEGHTILVNFTDTSCDTPKVVVTDQGATKEWMLFEAP